MSRTHSYLTLSPLLAFLVSCSSTPKAYHPGASVDPIAMGVSVRTEDGPPLLAQPLTKDGDNFRPVFSPDGSKLYFVSENREAHKHLQAYELEIATHVERRITYHDGDVSAVLPLPDGKSILYASATDEIKEDPHFINDLRQRYATEPQPTSQPSSTPTPSAASEEVAHSPQERIPGTLESREPKPAELYEARIDGSHIRRLTTSRGFDGEPAMGGKGRYVVFSSDRDKKRELYAMTIGQERPKRLTSHPLRDTQPSVTADGQFLAWTRFADDFTSSHIHIAEGRSMTSSTLTTKPTLNVTPSWHPNGQELIFSSRRGDGASFDLYTSDRKGSCLKRLTDSKSDETFPVFSPDGRKVAFSSNHSGRYQIYIMEHKPLPVCLTDLP